METRASYVLIGAFTLAVLLLAMAFALWIGKIQLDQQWDEYDVVFKEAVTGLSVGGAVQFNGIQVGDVRGLTLSEQDSRQVIARIRVVGNTPVTTETTARLTFQGLTGVAIIQLAGGEPGAPALVANAGEPRPIIVADDSAWQKLLASGEDVVTNVNEVIVRLSRLLNDENVAKAANTINSIDTLTSTLAARSDEIGRAIDELAEASAALNATLGKTEALVTRLDSTAASAQTMIDGEGRQTLINARESLAAVRKLADSANAILEANKGSIDSAAGRGLGQLAPTLAELRLTMRRLEAVATRLDEDPSALISGKNRPREYPAQ